MGVWVPATGISPQVWGSVDLGGGNCRDLSEQNPVPATGLGPGLRGLGASNWSTRRCAGECVSTSEDQAGLAGEWVKQLRSQREWRCVSKSETMGNWPLGTRGVPDCLGGEVVRSECECDCEWGVCTSDWSGTMTLRLVCPFDSNWGEWEPGEGAGQIECLSSTAGGIHTAHVCIYSLTMPLHLAQPDTGAGWGHWFCLCSCECSVCLSVSVDLHGQPHILECLCALCASAYWEYILSLTAAGTWGMELQQSRLSQSQQAIFSPNRYQPGVLSWFSLAGPQVPTKATPSLPLLKWTGEKKYDERLKGSWVEIRTGRDHSPIAVTGKRDWTWGNEFNLSSIKSD